MRQLARMVLLLIVAGLASLLAFSQDGQSLGDIARKKREQRQQKDAADGHAAKATKVLSDQTTSGHPGEPAEPASDDPQKKSSSSTSASTHAKGDKVSAEQWKEKILAAKSEIGARQTEIDRLNASVQMAPGNCVRGCVEWNEHQVEKQQKVEQLRGQLDEKKKQLEEMQDSARRQGYGTGVYDP